MKRLWAAVAGGILALAGCGDGESEAPETSSPSVTQETSDAPAEEDGPPIALDSVCDLLLEQSAMPHDDEVEYVDARAETGEYMVRCYIEPKVWGDAAVLGEVGRDDMKFCDVYPGPPGIYEPFESGRDAEDYLVQDGDDIYVGEPADWPDGSGSVVGGHQYHFLFKAELAETCLVEHNIEFYVPDLDGCRLEDYRPMAYEIFTTYMDALAAEL